MPQVLKKVEELILYLSGPIEEYRLPEFLFSHSSLRQLETWYCLYVPGLKVNFESLKVLRIRWSKFGDGVIETVVCGSPVLESLELSYCHGFKHLAVASKSLKKLSIEFGGASLVEVDCPKLDQLFFGSTRGLTYRLKLPSLICATFRISHDSNGDSEKQFLKQFPHVEDLTIVGEFVKTALKVGGLSHPLNTKNLTLVCYQFGMPLREIKYALCNSPLLEKLVIKLLAPFLETADLPGLIDFEETYRNSNGNGYTCLGSHLKTVKIIGLSKKYHKSEDALRFVGFLLKNARALEKMVVELADGGTEFLAEVSQKLLKFPRCSPHGIVEVI